MLGQGYKRKQRFKPYHISQIAPLDEIRFWIFIPIFLWSKQTVTWVHMKFVDILVYKHMKHNG